ncbi:MAG: DNA translocase FtsK [Prevotellaceae bacterium]|jgi:S-DNA-T family DNA segregation ATPase FtsK/SpoIIIE|nr:DNA translocase FtsK [Prevotellaceae bacterium]
MAKKKKASQETKSKGTNDNRKKFIIGLLLLGFALFLSISFISYCFTWQNDQSLLNSPNFSDPNLNAYNKGGKIGYWIAAELVGHYFGLGAFGIPLIIILIGLQLLKYKSVTFTKSILAIIFGSILLSVVSSYIFSFFGNTRTWLGNGLGGIHGFYVNRWLVSNLGGLGTAISLVILIIAYSIFLNKNTIFALKRLFFASIEFIKKLISKAIKYIFAKTKRPDKQPVDQTENNKEERREKDNDNDDDIIDLTNEITVREEEQDDPGESDFTVIRNPDEDETVNPSKIKHDIEIEVDGGKQALLDDTLPDYMLEGSEIYDPTRDLLGYMRPPVDLLEDYKTRDAKVSNAELEKNKDKIVSTLNNYKIGIDKIIATIGPTVTLYEIVPKAGVRISSIRRLEDDIALSLAALGIRIIAPIPGKGTVGIEVPNEKPDIVSMQSIIKSAKFQEAKYDLPVALGKTISNETYVFDLAKMPHLLVAGATGQGKSVGLNAILTSLLYKKHPAELKIVMVDPKKVELTPYEKIEKHFLAKMPDSNEAIITDTQKVIYTLKSLCIEMDNRYDLLKAAGVRNVKEYNEKFVNRRLNPLKGHRYMPYIVVVIDEFADMIMTAGREIEEPIARLAQLARAIGIHLIIATQRPTTNIITGLIKANFPARIAFRVTSMIDSRTILDSPGANQLIGRGDMLVSTGSDLIRVQCAFVDTPEVDKITDFIGKQPGYAEAYELPEYVSENGDGDTIKNVDLKKRDDMFEEAARMVVQYQQGSTSLLQRKLELGYNRAGRIMDQLEAAGIVGPSEGSKARQVHICDFKELDVLLERLRGL